jgi:uncharacterized Zn finger protein
MHPVTVKAISSSGGSYNVQFSVAGDTVTVTCDCQAGLMHQVCKHRLALVRGDSKMLFSPAQSSDLQSVHAWPQFVKLQSRVSAFECELKAIEKAKAALAQKEKALKSTLAVELLRGGY